MGVIILILIYNLLAIQVSFYQILADLNKCKSILIYCFACRQIIFPFCFNSVIKNPFSSSAIIRFLSIPLLETHILDGN